MEVASAAFAPCPTQLTRRHPDLGRIGTDGGFERGRSARCYVRIDVGGWRESELARQTELAPVLCAPELAKGLIADNWQRAAGEVGAVLEDGRSRSAGARATVAEAVSLEGH